MQASFLEEGVWIGDSHGSNDCTSNGRCSFKLVAPRVFGAGRLGCLTFASKKEGLLEAHRALGVQPFLTLDGCL